MSRARPPHPSASTGRRGRLLVRGVLAAAVLSTVGCSGDGIAPGTPIDRETFIATYVDLRIAALDADSGHLGEEARAEVLTRHGVTAEHLLDFADLHGRDVEFMRDVWNEVEVRLDARRPGSDGGES